MIAFGLMDQFIMIRLGDLLDNSLGVTLGLATLTAAAVGQLCSDTAGVVFGNAVESVAQNFLRLSPPPLTPAQRLLPSCSRARTCGAAFGVALGCLLGMSQLLFLDLDRAERVRHQQQLDGIFESVIVEGPRLFECERGILYLYDKTRKEIWTKAICGDIHHALRLQHPERGGEGEEEKEEEEEEEGGRVEKSADDENERFFGSARKSVRSTPGKKNQQNTKTGSMVIWVLENKKILNLTNPHEDSRFNPYFDERHGCGTHSVLAAPILRRRHPSVSRRRGSFVSQHHAHHHTQSSSSSGCLPGGGGRGDDGEVLAEKSPGSSRSSSSSACRDESEGLRSESLEESRGPGGSRVSKEEKDATDRERKRRGTQKETGRGSADGDSNAEDEVLGVLVFLNKQRQESNRFKEKRRDPSPSVGKQIDRSGSRRLEMEEEEEKKKQGREEGLQEERGRRTMAQGGGGYGEGQLHEEEEEERAAGKKRWKEVKEKEREKEALKVEGFTEADERMVEMMAQHIQIFMDKFDYGAAEDRRVLSINLPASSSSPCLSCSSCSCSSSSSSPPRSSSPPSSFSASPEKKKKTAEKNLSSSSLSTSGSAVLAGAGDGERRGREEQVVSSEGRRRREEEEGGGDGSVLWFFKSVKKRDEELSCEREKAEDEEEKRGVSRGDGRGFFLFPLQLLGLKTRWLSKRAEEASGRREGEEEKEERRKKEGAKEEEGKRSRGEGAGTEGLRPLTPGETDDKCSFHPGGPPHGNRVETRGRTSSEQANETTNGVPAGDSPAEHPEAVHATQDSAALASSSSSSPPLPDVPTSVVFCRFDLPLVSTSLDESEKAERDTEKKEEEQNLVVSPLPRDGADRHQPLAEEDEGRSPRSSSSKNFRLDGCKERSNDVEMNSGGKKELDTEEGRCVDRAREEDSCLSASPFSLASAQEGSKKAEERAREKRLQGREQSRRAGVVNRKEDGKTEGIKMEILSSGADKKRNFAS